ncbi:hypothetical protein CPC08DRAFT_644478 [Agrocybe pediades]|nr:hypothetical protein CPC08DRAFT_644478 [Agrocybe pediades]
MATTSTTAGANGAVLPAEKPTVAADPSSSKPPNRSRRSHAGKRKFDLRGLKKYRPSITLENAGNVARDHLASERTFLAYVRTSLALASTGVALVQLFTIAELTSRTTNTALTEASKRVQRFARPLGVTTVLLALVVLALAVYRYFLIQNALPEHQFPIARYSIVFTSFIMGAIIVVIFAALLAGRQ